MNSTGNKERIWIFPISSIVNFGALILLFTTILFLHQLAQKSMSDKPAEEVASAAVKPEVKIVKKVKEKVVEKLLPVKPISTVTAKTPAPTPMPAIMAIDRKEIIAEEKIPYTSDPLKESIAAKKRNLAMGNFIPFEKTRP